MAFKDTYRLEKVYYENMWTLLKSLKALKENPSADEITKVNEILDDTIACNESIIIIYKNLGELYAEVAQKFVDLLTDLKAIRDDLEMWKNEINEKIDDVNNYLMEHIRDLDDRVTSLEGRMDTAEGDIDALEGRMDTAEGDIDALEGRMDTAEDDIDGLQDDVSDLQQNKQDKLTAGFGIEIDANNEISVDTNDVQEKLIAGQNITLTPDSTDPTKTVIDAQGGSSYTAGHGISIDSSDVIFATDEALFLSSVGTLQSVSLNTSDIATLMQSSSNDYEIGTDNKHYRDGSGGGGDSVSFSGKKRVRITATMLTDKEYTSAMASGLPFVDKQEADFEVSARISILQGSNTYWCENMTVHGEIVSHHNTSLNKDYVYFRAFEERTALIELDPTKSYKIHVYFYWYMKGDVFLHNTLIQNKFGNLANLFGIEAYS